MYPVQYGGAKPLKELPLGYKFMRTKDGKYFLGDEVIYTTDVINIKRLFGYTFYNTNHNVNFTRNIARYHWETSTLTWNMLGVLPFA